MSFYLLVSVCLTVYLSSSLSVCLCLSPSPSTPFSLSLFRRRPFYDRPRVREERDSIQILQFMGLNLSDHKNRKLFREIYLPSSIIVGSTVPPSFSLNHISPLPSFHNSHQIHNKPPPPPSLPRYQRLNLSKHVLKWV